MRVVVDEDQVKRRAATAQRGIILGVALLGAAAVLSFNPRYVLLAYGLIVPGVIVASWASRSGEKWLTEPRADQLLDKTLKGLTQGYNLYSYRLPAQHVLLSPAGLFVLKIKRQDGKISCRGEKWHRPITLRRLWRFLTEEPLGNPTKEVRGEVRDMQRFVDEHLPDADVPIEPLIVFTNATVDLDVVDPAIPTMPVSDLKAYLRGASKGRALPKQTQKALRDLFDEQFN
jgi:hypothetical protein